MSDFVKNLDPEAWAMMLADMQRGQGAPAPAPTGPTLEDVLAMQVMGQAGGTPMSGPEQIARDPTLGIGGGGDPLAGRAPMPQTRGVPPVDIKKLLGL
jgi:hypothetical protein